MMNDTNLILVPIRYPLTAQSTQTLANAERIANKNEAHLLILHVNLFQYNENIKAAEIHQAVKPILEDTAFSVTIRQGFLVEEIILEEARQLDVNTIVIGEKQTSWWKRLLTVILRNEPNVASYLRKNAGLDIEVTPIK